MPEYRSIYQLFADVAQKSPKQNALIYLGETYTYSQLAKWVEQLAGALYLRGICQQDRVMIYMPHCPQWIIAWLAIQRLGAICVPVTHFYGPKDLRYIANDCGAQTIFCMDTNFGYVSKVIGDTSLTTVVVSKIVDYLPRWKKWFGHLFDRIPDGKFALSYHVTTFPMLLKEGRTPAPAFNASGEEIAEMLYTGGTTGYPKGVPMSHLLFLASFREQRRGSESVIPLGQDIVLQGAPLYHMMGQVIFFGAMFMGETVILLPKIHLDAIFDHIERYKVKTFVGTPTLYRMMLEHDRIDQYNLGSLVYCFCGGDSLPQEVGNRWKRKFGHALVQGYGATETGGGVANTPAGVQAPEGAAGKLFPYQKVMIVDSSLIPQPPNEPGELLVSSDFMVREYWNKPVETATSFVKIDGRLWYRTGDIVKIDDEDWLYFLDRSVDLIKHKGYRVAASKIDAVLQEHHAVIAACTVGVPDEAVGERIKSFVVTREDVKGINSSELIKWCKDRLASYEVPQYIEFRDMLPKSKVGKLLRRELRAEERRKTEAI